MALQMGKPVPLAAADAYYIVEMGCSPSLAELDDMPSRLVDVVLLYKQVKGIAEYGGTLKI